MCYINKSKKRKGEERRGKGKEGKGKCESEHHKETGLPAVLEQLFKFMKHDWSHVNPA